ncbi:MAG: hypothetical protein K9M45_12660 [Kiritimatiellales bacterium]|nr:hypothetical protein [Kiritimatiellales bacterium]
MEPTAVSYVCAPSCGSISDVIPMLVVVAVFLLAGWLIRRFRKRRNARRSLD